MNDRIDHKTATPTSDAVNELEQVRQAGFDDGYEDGRSSVLETLTVRPGWARPEWAGNVSQDGQDVIFERVASVVPLELSPNQDEETRPSAITLGRVDRIEVDPETCEVRIIEGETHVHVDIEEVSVPEARRLIAALSELVEAVNGSSTQG